MSLATKVIDCSSRCRSSRLLVPRRTENARARRRRVDFAFVFFFRDRGADCSIPPPLLQRQCLSSLPVVPGSRLMRASRSAFGPFLLTSVAASCAASLGGFRHAASRLSSDNRNNNDNNTSKRPQSRFSCRCCCCCCFSGTPPLLLRPAVAL